MNKNYFVIPCAKNGIAYVKYDIKSNTYKEIYMTEDSESDNLYESLNLENKSGVIIFENSYINIYAILKSGNKSAEPSIFLVSKDVLDDNSDKATIKFLNYGSNIQDIVSLGIKTLEDTENYIKNTFEFDKINYSRVFGMYPTTKDRNLFIESLTISEITDTVEVEAPDKDAIAEENEVNIHIEEDINKIDTEESTPIEKSVYKINTEEVEEDINISEDIKEHIEKEISIEEFEENKKGEEIQPSSNVMLSIDDISKLCKNIIKEYTSELITSKTRYNDILNKEEELKNREEILRNKENDLENKIKETDKLRVALEESIAIAKDNTVELISEEVVGVKSIVGINDNTDIEKLPSNLLTYEALLKLLINGDSISIPKEVYGQLIITLKKNLYMNISYTEYRAIVQIRFEHQSINHMLAVVDVEEESEYIKLTVIKPYNSMIATQEYITEYELKYNEWRKQNSYRYI